MKKLFLSTLLLALPLLASAYDIAAENEDGVTIYYNYINNGTEFEVTYKSLSSSDHYSAAVINIPEEVTYMSRTRKVTSIGDYAFQHCTSLTSVTIPNSVTSIGDEAFLGCSRLASVTIPNSVNSIGRLAFDDCISLTSITIPNSVTSIGERAFQYCSSLTSVYITDVAAWCKITFNGYYSNPLFYAHHLFLHGEEIKDLVIPNSVTSIGDYAFYNCSGLTSITIPNSVTSIGEYAFQYCSSLTSVYITDVAAWCKITFNGYYSNPLFYAHHLFLHGEEIKDLVIPNSVTSIGSSAFYNCSSLTSVTIGNSVTSIGEYAFLCCTDLTSVTIGNSVTSIGRGSFEECRILTSVTIGNSVTSIGDGAFFNCRGLTSVTIPNSVTNIGDGAFYGCNGLTSVISKMENLCNIDSYCFPEDVFYNITLYVPKGTTDKYKSTYYWNKFLFIEEGEPGSSTQPDEKKCATPTISYSNKKLTFSCATEGVEYHYTITDTDIKSAVASSIDLSATYEISVYATKSGYTNSDLATATLVWTDAVFTETTPSTSSAKAIAESIPMLISAQNGTITVRGEQNGLPLTVYTADGKMLGSAAIKDGQASISTNLQRGEIAIVKVGSKSVKIKM